MIHELHGGDGNMVWVTEDEELGEAGRKIVVMKHGASVSDIGSVIRQIEAKALRKLRHPTRSEPLRSFLEIE